MKIYNSEINVLFLSSVCSIHKEVVCLLDIGMFDSDLNLHLAKKVLETFFNEHLLTGVNGNSIQRGKPVRLK